MENDMTDEEKSTPNSIERSTGADAFSPKPSILKKPRIFTPVSRRKKRRKRMKQQIKYGKWYDRRRKSKEIC